MLFLVLACETENTTENTGYRFPLDYGNFWKYVRIQNITDINPAFSERNITDTVYIDTILVSAYEYNHPVSGAPAIKVTHFNADSSRGVFDFYSHTSEGLFCDHGGTTPDLNTMLLFPYKYENYMNVSILTGFPKSAKNFDFVEKTLIYPLEVGTRWETNASGEVIKEVVAQENITINGISSNAYKIEYTYTEDSKATTTEYVSEIGLLKRERIIPNIEIKDPHPLAVPYIANYHETWEIIEYDFSSGSE